MFWIPHFPCPIYCFQTRHSVSDRSQTKADFHQESCLTSQISYPEEDVPRTLRTFYIPFWCLQTPKNSKFSFEVTVYQLTAMRYTVFGRSSIIGIIIVIIIIVSFMHDIHTHIPKTNHVPRGYIVAAILSLLFMVPLFLVPALALLFFYISTFRSMCAVPNMAVFCSSVTSCFLLWHSRILLLLLLLLLFKPCF
jgi:hypothetical protein